MLYWSILPLLCDLVVRSFMRNINLCYVLALVLIILLLQTDFISIHRYLVMTVMFDSKMNNYDIIYKNIQRKQQKYNCLSIALMHTDIQISTCIKHVGISNFKFCSSLFTSAGSFEVLK
jgi:hypothetical protein